jgi:hypothetical protein
VVLPQRYQMSFAAIEISRNNQPPTWRLLRNQAIEFFEEMPNLYRQTE